MVDQWTDEVLDELVVEFDTAERLAAEKAAAEKEAAIAAAKAKAAALLEAENEETERNLQLGRAAAGRKVGRRR